jgi:3-oxoacyl-[acyl-carrier protein] reductase
MSEAVLNETIKRVPLRRLGRPDELAEAVIRLMQDDFFNGKVFELDGGLVI